MLVYQFRHFPDGQSGPAPLAFTAGGRPKAITRLGCGDPPRGRTENLLIKSQLLCQLS